MEPGQAGCRSVADTSTAADQSSLRRPQPAPEACLRGPASIDHCSGALGRGPGAAAGRGCQTKETHDEGLRRPFPTGRQALRRDRRPADAEPHQKKNGQRLRYYVSRRLIQHSGQKDLSGWRLAAPMLEQTVVHLIRKHVDTTTFSASLIHTPTMQELASVHRFLDGLCSGTNDDSDPAARLLRLIRRVDISPGSVSILLDRNTFAACLSMGPERIREDNPLCLPGPRHRPCHCRRPPARWADLELPLASSASRRLGETASARRNAVSLQRPLRGWARLAASCSPTRASTNQPQPGPNSLSWFPDSDSSCTGPSAESSSFPP